MHSKLAHANYCNTTGTFLLGLDFLEVNVSSAVLANLESQGVCQILPLLSILLLSGLFF